MHTIDALAKLYAEMEVAYDKIATLLEFSCRQCPDNCCDSYFQHHGLAMHRHCLGRGGA